MTPYDARSSQLSGSPPCTNTLHAITERGLVRELPFANATRFDVNLSPHANLVCTRCGSIEDSEECNELIAEMRNRISSGDGFAPAGQRIDFYGLCRSCASSS